MTTENQEHEPQYFVCDYEDCQENHKGLANIPFVIPEIRIEYIDKLFLEKKPDYHIRAMLHIYKSPTMRVIHGWRQHEIHVLGRTIQAIYN